MCDIDDGERCEVWCETQRRARKPHRCNACHGPIGEGEIYLVHFSKFEGYVSSEKMCVECELARQEFADAHNGVLWSPSIMRAMLTECIDEGATADEEGGTIVDPEDARWQMMVEAMDARRQPRPTVKP